MKLTVAVGLLLLAPVLSTVPAPASQIIALKQSPLQYGGDYPYFMGLDDGGGIYFDLFPEPEGACEMVFCGRPPGQEPIVDVTRTTLWLYALTMDGAIWHADPMNCGNWTLVGTIPFAGPFVGMGIGSRWHGLWRVLGHHARWSCVSRQARGAESLCILRAVANDYD